MIGLSPSANAQQYVNPVFVGVERVNIAVNITPSAELTKEAQASLPEPLRKENLEKMLKEIYTERFKGHQLEGTVPGTYGRNNQRVRVLNFNDTQDRMEITKQSLDSKTLTVFFQGSIIRRESFVGLAGDSDFFSYQLTNYRHGITASIQQQIHAPKSVTLSTPAETINKFIFDYIKNRID
ncbi:MAG: hypothetical protein ACXW30_02415 [Micavibrio sp.]